MSSDSHDHPAARGSLPSPGLSVTWAELAAPPAWRQLATVLLPYVLPRRWFRAKARRTDGARILDVVPLEADAATTTLLVLLEISYQAGHDGAGVPAQARPRDVYVVPLARAAAPPAAAAPVTARIATCADGVLVDGLVTGQAADSLLRLVREGRTVRGRVGELRAESSPALAALAGGSSLEAKVPQVEQTNSTLTFGDVVLLKIYREVTAGPSPELEVGRFLTVSCAPPCAPRVLGALVYHAPEQEARVVAIAHELVANSGDAWSLARRELQSYFDRVAAAGSGADPETPVGRFLTLADTLGRRTGELHLGLAGRRAPAGHDPWSGEGAAFRPEALTAADRAAQAGRVADMLDESLDALVASKIQLSPAAQELAATLLASGGARAAAGDLLARFRDGPLDTDKTRTHGDLHLGQVLVRAGAGGLGDDFMIIDFEGEPARPLAERRALSSPIRDVMGMARSFDYAPAAVLRERGSDAHALQPAAVRWTREVTKRYLAAYRATVGDAGFIPHAPEQLSLLFAFYELEKVVYELGYELDNRPDWVEIPLRGLARILDPPTSTDHQGEVQP